MSSGPIYKYEIPIGDGSRSAWLHLPRELDRADADKLKRVIDALAFDDEVLQQWAARRAARELLPLVLANLIRMWVTAPRLAAERTYGGTDVSG